LAAVGRFRGQRALPVVCLGTLRSTAADRHHRWVTDGIGPPDGDDLVLVTVVPTARLSIGVAVVLLGVLMAEGWAVRWVAEHAGGLARGVGVSIAGVVGLATLLLLGDHVRHIGDWLRWRHRPVPALRLTASGIDYSPAFTGEFPFHMPWGSPMESAYRQGSTGRGLVWCLYSPIVEGLGTLPAWMDRAWPLSNAEVRADFRTLVREAGVDQRDPVQLAAALHLTYYGTPIAINPYLVSGADIELVDERLRARTNGQCTLQLPRHRTGPTVDPEILE
jgi:hypothetical protein